MGDFFDINNDGKLDSFERSMKDMYIINSVEELEKENQASARRSSPPKNDFDPKSSGDHFLAAFGAGCVAVGAGFLGYYTISFSSFLGGVCFLAAIVFGIVAFYYLIKGVSITSGSESHKHSGSGGKGIIIGVIVLVLAVVGVVFFVTRGKQASSESDPQDSVTGTSSKQTKSDDSAAKEASRTKEEKMVPKDKWDDYPAKYREIFRAAESGNLNLTFLGVEPKKTYLEWINELNMPGNAFAEFIAEKRDALNLKNHYFGIVIWIST